ncbi:hypothetical protein [Mediterraneibacter faecis]|uniref:hypothetical protein n=1 Tax=Mediterraneibacter faecis TaxID=592978 RepID=UPI003F9CC9AC
MTPKEMNVYKKIQEDKEREKAIMQDISAWMNGLYVLQAISCVVSKSAKYPEAHMIVEDFNENELTDEEIEEIVHGNTQIAAANFAAWAEVANSIEQR